MKKSTRWLIVSTIALLGICCLSSYQVAFKRCLFWTCVPNRNFSVLDLSIPSSYFPKNSTVGEIDYSSEFDGAIEKGHQQVFWRRGNGLANYIIRRFGTEWQARFFIDKLNEIDKEYGLETCPALKDVKVKTDEHSFTCGLSRFGGYRGNLQARYDEYVVTFHTIIDDEMSMEQFQQIVGFIDDQMQDKLELK